jgi:hypothetical protein
VGLHPDGVDAGIEAASPRQLPERLVKIDLVVARLRAHPAVLPMSLALLISDRNAKAPEVSS